jgi:CRISPR-associated protein Csm4
MLKAFVFKPLSPFKSFPTTNTIFGAICWGIRWLESGEKLLETLEMFKTGRPPFIISAPLLWREGRWIFQRPIHFNKNTEGRMPKDKEEYRRYKELKKVRWISWEVFRETLEREPKESFEGEKTEIRREIILHASINRLTITTVGGELYNEEVHWLSSFGVIVKFFDESFEPLVRACLEFSQLGGNKTTGMGRYRFEETEPPEGMEEFISQKSTRAFLISDCFYDPEFDLNNSFYDIKVQKPAVENGLTKRVWKNTFCYLTPGSQVRVKTPKDWYGGIKEVLKEGSISVYQYGIGFPLFARW